MQLYYTNGFSNIFLKSVNCLWLVSVTFIFDGTPQIIVQQHQIAALRWPNDISSAADNVSFKNRVQNIECTFGCVALSAGLLKLNVANILLFNFCKQKFVQYIPLTITVDCNGHSLLIFEGRRPNYVSGPKSVPNSDSFWLRRLSDVCVRVFCAPNAIILLVYIPAKIKLSFIWKDNSFAKIGIFHKLIIDSLREAKNIGWSIGFNS